MFYEIKSRPKDKSKGATYEAHNVKKGKRMSFVHNGNQLFGNVVGCGTNSLILEVDALSF